jgi:hypothetical protein
MIAASLTHHDDHEGYQAWTDAGEKTENHESSHIV